MGESVGPKSAVQSPGKMDAPSTSNISINHEKAEG